MKIMVKNLQEPELGWVDIYEWKDKLGIVDGWFDKIIDAILNEQDLQLSKNQYYLSMNPNIQLIQLVSNCTIPGVPLSFMEASLRYKVEY